MSKATVPLGKRSLAALLPKLAKELRELLELDELPQLADQISRLKVIDRCRCDDEFCGTFYTAPPPKGAWGPTLQTIPLELGDSYLILDVVKGKIVLVEVLHRDDVRDRLREVFP